MKKYFWLQTKSLKKGRNINISVYEFKKDRFAYIGESDHNSGAWRGGIAGASKVLNEKRGHKITINGDLVSKNIMLIQIPC